MSQTKWNKKSVIVIVFSLLFFLCNVNYTKASGYYLKANMYFKSSCSIITNESQCSVNGCYWWDNSCHSYKQELYVNGKYCIPMGNDITLCVASSGTYSLIIENYQQSKYINEKYCIPIDNDITLCVMNDGSYYFIAGGIEVNP